MLNDVSEILKAIKSLKLFDASFRDFITEKRFGTGIFCPRCNSSKVHKNGGTSIIRKNGNVTRTVLPKCFQKLETVL